ncbi:MAG: type IX secretion system protein PorQ [Bacteroidales bacterium]|nr:type IX secretion system protein PorQ [Bacteroidales bacterium]
MNRNTLLHLTTILILILSALPSFGQNGGNAVYKFLNLTSSARSAALGGNFMAVKDGDLSQALFNPSVISPEMDNQLSMSFVDYFAGVNYGFASYANSFEKIGSYAATIQYLSYGDFTYADQTGQTAGTFKASELALNFGWGRQLDSLFTIGANMKFIYSGFEDYQSYGLAVDVAGSYVNPEHRLIVSLIARNIGTQLKPYVSGNTETLPLEINLGMSQRLKHLPFRYSILLTNLQKWDLSYDDPNDPDNKVDPITGEVIEADGVSEFLDNAMRHVVIGGEFLPTKNFTIRFGYNYQRRQELGVTNKMGTVGFSWGIGLRISKFKLDYSRATYHLNGSPNYFTISTNLSELF